LSHTRPQDEIDFKDLDTFGRVARIRPGDHVSVSGVINRKRGPTVRCTVINSRVSGGVVGDDEVLVASREYGRRWFAERGSAFLIMGED